MKAKRNRMPTGTMRLRGSIYWAQWKHRGQAFAISLNTKEQKLAQTRFRKQMVLVNASILDGTHDRQFGQPDARNEEQQGDITLAAAWDRFTSSPRRPDCSAGTLQQYQYQFEHFVEWAGKHRPDVRLLARFGEDDAMAFASHLEHEVSPSTYNRYRDLLVMVFRVLLTKNGNAPLNPWAAVQRKRFKRSRGRRAFTEDELRRIFLTLQKRIEGRQLTLESDGTVSERALGEHDQDSADEMLTVAMLGMYTGMRMGDCCLLRWEEVDFGRGAVVRVPSKTASRSDKPVIVPMHQDLRTRLLAVRPDAASGFVCPCKAEQYRINRSDVSKRFSTLFRQCGIRLHREEVQGRAQVEVGFHSLRYSFVSNCRRGKGSLAAVESLVGHTNPEMTRHYTDVSHDEAVLAIASLPSVLAGGTPAATPESATAKRVSAMGDDEFRQLADAVAAEAARRRG